MTQSAGADNFMTSVLIIDNRPFAVQGCRRILADAGIEPILVAEDVEKGYALYQQIRPDVVTVDLAFAGDRLADLSPAHRIKAIRKRSSSGTACPTPVCPMRAIERT
jgi:DNA-binding NarL/FixJ family response regulator